MTSFTYQRVVVVGVTSSGKSTLAETLAKRFDLNYIELDALHWEPNWQSAPLDVFRARVESVTQAERWIVAGNYHVVRDLIWPKAEAVIWLDYPLRTVLWQLTRRTFKRWWTQELLWDTNANVCGPISSSGLMSHSITGCSKPIGEESANTLCCCRSQGIDIWH
jgi:adenylate kinase family enzyme